MNWYSQVADLAKQFSARVSDRTHEAHVADGEILDGETSAAPFLLTNDGQAPRHGFSSEFFSPGASLWAPSAEDRILEAFDVSQPVAQPEDLRGREKELSRLLSGVLYRRNHGVVSGPRGSGKTSLVRVFGQHADREGVVVLYAACDSQTSFGELLRDFLEQIPPSSVDVDEVPLLEARVASFHRESSPHHATSILAQIKYSQVVIIVDEFDRIDDVTMHAKMASLLKLVSDARLPVRFVLVGGSGAFSRIMGQHASLVRHITRLSTDPLSDAAIHELLRGCAERCRMTLAPDALSLLEQVACGSPYHARLFGMHAALCASERKSDEISQKDVLAGLADSFEEWASLNKEDAATFRSIIDGAHGNPAAYVEVARQLATCGDDEGAGRSRITGARDGTNADEILSAFGSAVERREDGASFRDATAPQFFIALQKFAGAPKSRTRANRSNGA